MFFIWIHALHAYSEIIVNIFKIEKDNLENSLFLMVFDHGIRETGDSVCSNYES